MNAQSRQFADFFAQGYPLALRLLLPCGI